MWTTTAAQQRRRARRCACLDGTALVVRVERGGRFAPLIEVRELCNGEFVGAALRELRANETDHLLACSTSTRDQLFTAALCAVIPQLEEALLARRCVVRDRPQAIEVLLRVLATLRELLRAVALAQRGALVAG